MKKIHMIAFGLAATLCVACSPPSPIGLVDVERIAANWPEYQNDQRQFTADENALAASHASLAVKRRQDLQLRGKYAAITDGLVKQIQAAATKIAQDRNLKLVVTTEGVGYGGNDITKDVEKALNITSETVTPAP